MIDVPIECPKCVRGTLEPNGRRLSDGRAMIGCDECPHEEPVEENEEKEILESLNT